ncbi:hypothetical protein [Pinibacter soli]|uniref:Ig-like domain-containing protein n=1 Tax=Pinibacter soli TaxID=3044211 RepID=A0ABT6RFM1_9BACT|nr:hypothetical protein [Pinibacter soli]MDI3320684.1 hypothetical protein [Pinibacter soli]
MLSKSDLFAIAYHDGLSESDASILRTTITVGDPLKSGKYLCSIQVIDNNNDNAAVHSTWDFEVT